MRKGSRRQLVHAYARDRLAAGIRPTFEEIGAATGMSPAGAWKHVQKLIGERKFIKMRGGFGLPPHGDLTGIPTQSMLSELARRGVTFDALERPKPLFDQGRVCAANHCPNRVRQGQLFCREHWFQLPPNIRSSIMNAWSARHRQAFQEALEAARDHLGGFTRVVERVQ